MGGIVKPMVVFILTWTFGRMMFNAGIFLALSQSSVIWWNCSCHAVDINTVIFLPSTHIRFNTYVGVGVVEVTIARVTPLCSYGNGHLAHYH